MNKRFLSALLAATLMVASTEVFVSCKDYDDDIDAINTELTQIKSQISAIEAKINGGQWITSVTPVTNGFTVTFSGGGSYTITNGKDGADGATGADGKNGTQWTISEDGYWVCDGVKTDVKAVGVDGKDGANGADGENGKDGVDGKDGKDGKDALNAVKKENGKWYLWNGTEYEEFTVAAADNIPYCYTDPDDTNYAVLVIYDENGENKQEIRLPLNEGLAQIAILNADDVLTVNYAIYQVKSAKQAVWDGAKPAPVKGEYIITQSMDSILVQVTPTNYDLAAISSFSLVNSLSEAAPVAVGAPVAYNKVLTRAASKGGLYQMSVTADPITDESKAAYTVDGGRYIALSLKANDKVRSGYELKYKLNEVTSSPIIKFERAVTTKPGEPVTIKVTEGAEYLYDAYMYTANEHSKADSLKFGLETGKTLTVKSNADAFGTVNFTIRYCDVLGAIKEASVDVTFSDNKVVEVNNVVDTTDHVATGTKTALQYMLVDFTPYLKSMTEDERTYWNGYSSFDNSVEVTWSDIDPYPDRETEPVDVTGLVAGITKCNAKGKTVSNNADFTHLKVTFKENYKDADNNNVTLGIKNGATFTAQVRINRAANGEDHIVYVPFTIDNPVATEYSSLYTFNPAYFANGTLTLIDTPFDTEVDLSDYVKEGASYLDYTRAASTEKTLIPVVKSGVEPDVVSTSKIKRVTPTANPTTGVTPKAPTSTTISGWQVKYMDRLFPVSAFKVKFAASTDYTVVADSASVSILSGVDVERAKLYYRDVTTDAAKAAKYPNFFYLKAADGTYTQNGVTCKFIFGEEEDGTPIAENDYIKFGTWQTDASGVGYFAITAKKKVTVDTQIPVTVVCTIGGKEYTGEFTVTVKAYPVN